MARSQETRCSNPDCRTPCQGFRAPNGQILCAECLWKIWGLRPDEADND